MRETGKGRLFTTVGARGGKLRRGPRRGAPGEGFYQTYSVNLWRGKRGSHRRGVEESGEESNTEIVGD